jgi:hypothetical protein
MFYYMYVICIYSIYVYWCPTRFPYQMMFMLLDNSVTRVTIGPGTADPSTTPAFT